MSAHTLPDIDAYLKGLNSKLLKASKPKLFQAIVDAPFASRIDATMLDLGVVVLLLVNKKTGMIDRVALSDTHSAKGAANISEKRFEEIKIPADHEENIIAQAIRTGQPQETVDWKYLFIPDLSPRSARFNQAAAGIDCSVVYPFPNFTRGGALIFSYYQPQPKISARHHEFMKKYAELVRDAMRK